MEIYAHLLPVAAHMADAPVPLTTDWVPTLLLTIVWIFVAAAVAGALMRFMGKGRPRDT